MDAIIPIKGQLLALWNLRLGKFMQALSMRPSPKWNLKRVNVSSLSLAMVPILEQTLFI